MKSFKRFFSGAMVSAMMLAMLTSCSATAPADLKVRSKDLSTEETEGTTTSETIEPVVVPEPTETAPEPTAVPQKDNGFHPEYSVRYYNDYVVGSDKAVRVGNIYLSDETIEKYPDLASAIDSFNETNTTDMLYEIIDNLPETDGNVNCLEDVRVARADSQVFSFSVHYIVYSGNFEEGTLFDYIEAFSYDVNTGHLYNYEDIFGFDTYEDDYVYDKTGMKKTGDAYYLIGYNGVTVIAEREGGYDPADPVSTVTYTDFYDEQNRETFAVPELFYVQDCVIGNLGWDMDFITRTKDEKSLGTVIQDPVTGKHLDVQIKFVPENNSEECSIEMSVQDIDSSLTVASATFSSVIFGVDAFLFCREGNYSLALQYNGYDGVTSVCFLPFNGDGQLSDPVTIDGYLSGYVTDFSSYQSASDLGLEATECNSTEFVYFEKRIDLLGTYYYLDRYLLNDDMCPEDLVDIDRALTFFELPLKTAIDFDSRVGDSEEKVTLPAGTELYIYGVNAEDRTVFLTNGDDYYSLVYDALDDSYENKVDGVPDTDIFVEVNYLYGL